MHWEVLVVPLIALGVWILGTLFRSEDEKAKKGVGRRPFSPPQGGRARGGSRTPEHRVVTDLDRFLEEARRRRESEERRQTPPPVRVPPARPALRGRPTSSQTPRPAALSPTPPTMEKTRREEPTVAPPTPPPLASPPTPERSPTFPSSKLEEERIGTSLVRETPSPPAAPAVRPAPIAQQVRSLLSKPQTAALAFVLREIFDRPLCKRRR